MKYRAEIDGLRAVAVLPVILFHAGFASFPGGFVGVDVFFVISGFLITGILIDEIRGDRFSIMGFYERRARRILPALFAVLIACLPFAWMWLLDEQLSDFAASLGAVIVFLSNLYFLSQVSYFAPAAELQPLLHTWSLGVEEQYYLVFPLIVALSLRRGLSWLFAVILGLSVASLAISEVGLRLDAGRNFFFTLSRFWELGVGSLGAVAISRWGEQRNGTLALAGLSMILLAVFTYHKDMPFAGVYALLPVGGAILIILFGQAGTLAARLLSHAVPVGIGLVSYSAYLVHQPLFAFARIRSPEEPGTLFLVILCLASLGLGWASWRFVERPFRGVRSAALPGRAALFGVFGAVAAGLMAVAITLKMGEGFPDRMQERYAGEIGSDALLRMGGRLPDCQPETVRSAVEQFERDRRRCLQSRAEGLPTVVVLGDSHAEHLFNGIASGLPEENVAIYIQNGIPFPDTPRFSPLFEALAQNPNLHTVVYAMHWQRRFEELGDDAGFERRLGQTLTYLRGLGLRVIVAGDLPWFASEPPNCKYEVVPGNDRYCFELRADAEAVTFRYGPILQRVTKMLAVRVIPLRDLLCDAARCSMAPDGVMLLRDSNHLNYEGSMLVGGRIAAEIRREAP